MPPEGEAGAAPDQGSDTPEASEDTQQAPQEEQLDHDTSSEDTDWQKRYSDLQATVTPTQQELAEQRKSLESIGINEDWLSDFNDPETRDDALRWLLQQHGYLEDEEEGEEGEEDEFKDPRVDGLITQIQDREAEAMISDVRDHIEELASEKDLDLTERQLKAIMRDTFEAMQSPDDTEATEKVFSEWAADFERFGKQDAEAEQYRDSKRAPSPPQQGSPGTPEIDISDDKARLKLANEVAGRYIPD